MPKVSRESASQVNDYGPIAERREDLEGTAVQFLTANQDLDGTLLMKGLPDDRCSSPTGATCSRAVSPSIAATTRRCSRRGTHFASVLGTSRSVRSRA